MPPESRPFPRFIADASREGAPYGRFAEKLAAIFREACAEVEDRPDGTQEPGEINWFPERAWGGRVWVPATAFATTGESEIEFFGHVSYVQPVDGEPHDFRAKADFTDVFAEDNPDWQIDLNDEVIGRWVGEADQKGDVTLIWGRPLIPNATAVTAELDESAADQAALAGDRFTLIALDALQGFGDEPVYVEIKLWNRRREEIAAESLYESVEDEEGEESGESAEAAEGGSGDAAEGGAPDDESSRASDRPS